MVATSVRIATRWALAFYKSVCKERMMLLAIELSCNAFLQKAILVQLKKYVLSDIRLTLSCSSAKDVETDAEPPVYLGVDSVVLVAELLWRAFFRECFCLRRGAILVRS